MMNYFTNDSYIAESWYDQRRNSLFDSEEDFDPYEREEDIEEDGLD